MQLKNLVLPAALVAGASAKSLSDVIAGNANLTVLQALLDSHPTVLDAFADYKNITVLAPTNEALTRFISIEGGAAIVENPSTLAELLSYHILNGTYKSSEFGKDQRFFHTLLTNSSYSNVTGGQALSIKNETHAVEITSGLLKKTQVTEVDADYDDGTVHIINEVLTIPTSVNKTSAVVDLPKFSAALESFGLLQAVEDLKDVTIFAPSNQAFKALGDALTHGTRVNVQDILKYHVVPGIVGYSPELTNVTLPTLLGQRNLTITVAKGQVRVNGVCVIVPNILVAGGVIHVVDEVLFP